MDVEVLVKITFFEVIFLNAVIFGIKSHNPG